MTIAKDNMVLFLGSGFTRGICPDAIFVTDFLGKVLKDMKDSPKAYNPGIRDQLQEKIKEIFPHLRYRYGEANIEWFLDFVYNEYRQGNTNPKILWENIVRGISRILLLKVNVEDDRFIAFLSILHDISKRHNVTIITTNYSLVADKAAQRINCGKLCYDGRLPSEKEYMDAAVPSGQEKMYLPASILSAS